MDLLLDAGKSEHEQHGERSGEQNADQNEFLGVFQSGQNKSERVKQFGEHGKSSSDSPVPLGGTAGMQLVVTTAVYNRYIGKSR